MLDGDPDVLRAVRWFARVLTLAAAWPFWYAFYGGYEFDPEGMMFGGPGVLVGLALWTWSGYRLRHPSKGAPPAAPSSTIGGRLIERFDAQVPKLAGAPVIVVLGLASLGWAIGAGSTILATEPDSGELVVVYGVMAGLLALGWRALGRRAIAIATALLAGLALLTKPWVAPISVEFMGQRSVLSPTSETHLYFVLPGLALIGFAVILVLGTKLREPAVATPPTPEPTRLEPPQPTFPRPPGQQ